MIFEILCLDTAEKVQSRTVKTLLHALIANDNLWGNSDMDITKGEIRDEKNQLTVNVTQFPTDQVLTSARYSLAFTIKVTCENIEKLDTFRIRLVDYIKNIGFSNVRILLDEASAQFASSLYPTLYTLENKVRTFITNFFLKNLGTNWTKLAMSGDTLEKIKKRKNNDNIFISNNRIDSDVILIDFDELGRILYSENSILSNKKADNVTILIEKISTAKDLNILKSEVLEGNFYKYFKDCFTQKDFQNKWFDLYYYRNKIAHNGSFSREEVERCTSLCAEISSIIDIAYQKLDTFKLSTSDKEALMVAVNEIAYEQPDENLLCGSQYNSITEDTLLQELSAAQKALPFVGLKHFVIEWLGKKNYDYDASFTLINYLADKGSIKLNHEDNPNGIHPTTSISITK